MDLIRSYGKYIKQNIDNPSRSLRLLKMGFSLEKFLVSKFKDKNLPDSLNYLNKLCLEFILKPLRNPEGSAFVTIFSPVEIFNAMDITPFLLEGFSSFLSGTRCEDAFIDCAEKSGISDTLCSYHKAFIGAVEANVVPRPKFAVTSSMICDGNLNTIRYVSKKYNIPYYYLDIPYEYNEDTEAYVVGQLHEMVEFIQDIMKRRFDEERFREIIRIENNTKAYMRRFYKSLEHKYFPNTLTLEMYRLFASHLGIGRPEILDFYKMQAEDIEKYPDYAGKRILWSHIMPFYSDTLKNYFNLNPDCQLLACDYNLDNLDEMDYNHPYEAVAKKFLQNKLNGPFQIKIQNIIKMVHNFNASGVINLCSFGCKECSGGTMLLKEALKQKNIPYLSIDGDGVDRRNAHEGQIKTRVEAFMEILNSRQKVAK
ncbi:2-hydroxyacyl-CoA dehydratase subunit D [Clostridium luticellarii]|jgi:benzoyl-CoA reductase/2-hydroxyglutaryl-CoA dehydratase subunit BcrC/BadD/HgdB|uniref:R-phenyllactate dehydratase subunit alpha n=1 Tax=Clostridium luticellarii TaxID=1691940 RepID=A0A2T0BMD4_9CLOT|nr:2-hydroxyacyl-CoA dehydratase family protein [Clostridium luticellarii]MCI1944996.1 2-hydroxyacyl-CoA dehydratase family protein [Clostridium luticellarii]MCI1967854.1 2-hydroxyacyl-CoA dehydratase family protein [Clostridium luticellarii]MCI1995776.1 2-hydroxyacyl-CoA dehydratase family protein [Clostridium luticellarii]MCI2040915.1 2-hydroxyacyl-CoA dehydratase family protein [Clostridium luticellarii]PRR85044.1 R-phenyllactate dehydratase subunit alpha precursor [Clostridium luticellarii